MIVTILVVLAGLVGGYYYVKNFAQIDTALFGGNDPEYTPFGENYVYISAALGALVGCAGVFMGVSGSSDEVRYAMTFLSVLLLGVLAACAFFSSFERFADPGRIAAKSTFLLVSCILAFVVGAVGAVVVLIILAILCILWIVATASGGSGKKIKARGGLLEPDTELTHEYGDYYRDSSGHRWERNGSTVTKLD